MISRVVFIFLSGIVICQISHAMELDSGSISTADAPSTLPQVEDHGDPFLDDISVDDFSDCDEAPSNPKVAVLDLDKTLVYCSKNQYEGHSFGVIDDYETPYFCSLRPGLNRFLDDLQKDGFDIFIFTAATKDYADNIISMIDPDYTIFRDRYCRRDCLYGGVVFKGKQYHFYKKNLLKIVRDYGYSLDELAIVDDNPSSIFDSQKQRYVQIRPYIFGQETDSQYEDDLQRAFTRLQGMF